MVLAIMAMLSTVAFAAQVEVVAKIVRSSDSQPIEGALVTYTANGNNYSGGTTDSQGLAHHIFLEEGTTGEITAIKSDFIDNKVSFRVPSPPPNGPFIETVKLVSDNGGNSNDDPPVFSNIPDQFLDKDDDFHNNIIDLWAYASDDRDSDQELDFDLSQSDEDFIECFIDDDRFIDCTVIDEDEAGTVTLTVEVTDTDGQSDSENFRLIFEDEDAFCSEIEIENDELSIFENRTTTHDIRVFNNGSRTYRVDLVAVSESSPYFSVQPVNDDFSITPGDSEEVSLRFIAQSVTGTKTATIKLRLTGEFSNGVECHFDDIEEEIEVTIRDASSGDGDDDEVNVSLLPSSLELLPGQSKVVKAAFENNFSVTKCFDLELSENSSAITADAEDNDFCVNRDDEREIDIVISAAANAQGQNTTVQLKADYGTGTKFGFINVKIGSGSPGPTEPREITVTGFPGSVVLPANESKAFGATIGNKMGIDLTNVAVTMTGLPQGIFFEPVFIPRVSKDSITTVASAIRTTDNVQAGNYTVFLEVASDQGRTLKPVTLNVTNSGTAQDGTDNGFPTGFFGLAGLAGSAIVLLLLLVIVVAIIAAIIRRK
ncbi:MAG: hypothetical protein HY392_00205 [Candidatus Diapherotrites archaeon]|nr:hypothetical protein [Candidatus Diapherotrites archaeon]